MIFKRRIELIELIVMAIISVVLYPALHTVLATIFVLLFINCWNVLLTIVKRYHELEILNRQPKTIGFIVNETVGVGYYNTRGVTKMRLHSGDEQ